jgi:hypothetical protein
MWQPLIWMKSGSIVRTSAVLAAVLVTLTLALVIAVVGYANKIRNTATRENFAKIVIGMSQAQVHEIFGPPDIKTMELGLVEGPDRYTINMSQSIEERRARGFEMYSHEQWSSGEITVTAILDSEGKVVCRYSGSGQPGWRERLLASLPRMSR